MTNVRTRFAPSPTGFLHIGSVRAALYPWLLAKHYGGQFILRIEDTDQAREVEGALNVIYETLDWVGIDWDEGPDKGGPYGPYKQTERKEHYLKWAQDLIAKGRAYADPRSADDLDKIRADAKARKRPFLARDYRPDNNVDWQPGMPLRFLSQPKAYHWHDEVMGDLSAGIDAVDDFILLKSDGLPTYNFAHIVDDADMAITHVIRGLEYIASMPKYLNLYEALEIKTPVFVHMPHIMRPDGAKKLGKRDGAKSVLEYRDEGYLPEAMINFLALLGWNPGTTQEIFSTQELIEKFSLERIQRSGARFDERRLIWMNGNYIRNLTSKELYIKAQTFWPEEAATYDEAYKKRVLELVKDRLKYFSELADLTRFFFIDLPINSELIANNKKLSELGSDELKSLLHETIGILKTSDFSLADLTQKLNDLLEHTNQTPTVLFSLIRIASTQAPASPPLAESLSVIGKDRTINRLNQQADAL